MPLHAKIIQLGNSGKRSKPRPGISPTGTLLCIFILDPLTEAVFPLFASCDISRRACPAQNRTPAHLSSHQVSRTQNTARGPGPEASQVQRSCARETECGPGPVQPPPLASCDSVPMGTSVQLPDWRLAGAQGPVPARIIIMI